MTTIWNTEPPQAPPVADWPSQPSPDVDEPRFRAPTPPPLPPPNPSHLPKRRGGGWRVVFALVVMALLLGAGFAARDYLDPASNSANRTASNAATAVTLPAGTTPAIQSDAEEPVAAVAAAVSPAVVQIETTEGLGSGTIYDASGLILTNAHVLGTATSVTVRLADGTRYDGKLVGTDPSSDVAVVKIDGQNLPVARLSTETVEVGQIAVAMGSPFGLSQTVTAGIISAVDRPVPNQLGIAVNMLQTDAPINPGNSGGALANRNGEVIGMPTRIFSESGENNGIGFAVPIETAKRIADELVAGETPNRAALGVSVDQQGSRDGTGALVAQATAGGPAAEAGIEAGDVVVSIDGKPVRTFEELSGRLGAHSPGDTVTVEIERNGQTLSVEVVLGSLAK